MPARARRFRPARSIRAVLAIRPIGVLRWWILAAVAVCAAGCAERGDRPNVVLITLDTTRTDRLSGYGHDRDTSPILDALAADGVRFDRAIATAGLTPVSHASILTGLLPQQHGVRVLYAASGYRLPDAVPTLASVLADEGWRTGAFVSAFPVSEFFGFGHGFQTFDDGITDTDNATIEEKGDGWGFNIKATQRRSDDTTDSAIEWLRQSEDPFFAWLHYWDPHDAALVPPPEVESMYRSPGMGRKGWERALYDAEIHWVDRQIGRLLDALRESGAYENTIFVVVADHGEGLGDHDHWFHRILYQEQIRVPLIVRMPGGARGLVVSDLVRITDIFPTVLEALDLEPEGIVDGLPLQGLMAGQPEEPRHAYAEALILYDLNAKPLLAERPQDDVLHCMMNERWKLIHRPLRPHESELYDLQADPRELTNVFDDHPDVADELLARIEEMDPFVEGPFGEGQDAEAIERLRALGYVD